jgi:hypothetical protein
MTESGLVTCLDQLAEATATQLDQCDVAAATGSGVFSTTSQDIAASLFEIQVGSFFTPGFGSATGFGVLHSALITSHHQLSISLLAVFTSSCLYFTVALCRLPRL